MNEEKKFCDLCGLVVEISGFTLKIKTGEEKSFCCEGCKGIYQLLHGRVIRQQKTGHKN